MWGDHRHPGEETCVLEGVRIVPSPLTPGNPVQGGDEGPFGSSARELSSPPGKTASRHNAPSTAGHEGESFAWGRRNRLCVTAVSRKLPGEIIIIAEEEKARAWLGFPDFVHRLSVPGLGKGCWELGRWPREIVTSTDVNKEHRVIAF